MKFEQNQYPKHKSAFIGSIIIALLNSCNIEVPGYIQLDCEGDHIIQLNQKNELEISGDADCMIDTNYPYLEEAVFYARAGVEYESEKGEVSEIELVTRSFSPEDNKRYIENNNINVESEVLEMYGKGDLYHKEILPALNDILFVTMNKGNNILGKGSYMPESDIGKLSKLFRSIKNSYTSTDFGEAMLTVPDMTNINQYLRKGTIEIQPNTIVNSVEDTFEFQIINKEGELVTKTMRIVRFFGNPVGEEGATNYVSIMIE